MEAETRYPPMPKEVAAAIAAVMDEVPKLGRGEKNAHANYNFASIDDFLEAVRPLCSKHGLIIAQDEDSFEFKEGQDKNGKAVTWLVMRFAFTLAHKSGATWDHRPMRTIMVNANMGSQAFGAAQSYALKQFERSLFQIATGEKGQDADEHEQSTPPAASRAPRQITAKRAPEPSPEEKIVAFLKRPDLGLPSRLNDGDFCMKMAEAAHHAPDLPTLDKLIKDNLDRIKALTGDNATALTSTLDSAREQINQLEAAAA